MDDSAGRQRPAAQNRLQQRRFTDSVLSEDRADLAPLDRERQVRPQHPAADRDGGVIDDKSRPGTHLPVAVAKAGFNALSWATCQSTNDAPAGVRVSVKVTTGMLF